MSDRIMTVSAGHNKVRDIIGELAGRIDRALEECCSTRLSGPPALLKAMRYSLTGGGKRFRPALTLLACRACGGREAQAMIPAVAVEMVHTFSLVHDDLPALDDDELRRGNPTSHKVFGEAMAILAGDALLIFAFELMGRYVEPAALAGRMSAELARAAGPAGMTGGQVMDIFYASDNSDPGVPEHIHMLKTAALIRCSTRLGAIAAGVDEARVDALGRYGENLGLAYQIVDDLLDVTGTTDALGKQAGKDAEAGKPNLAVLLGADPARERAESLIVEAVDALSVFGADAETLRDLARFTLGRES